MKKTKGERKEEDIIIIIISWGTKKLLARLLGFFCTWFAGGCGGPFVQLD
jgi:hypothetical protein